MSDAATVSAYAVSAATVAAGIVIMLRGHGRGFSTGRIYAVVALTSIATALFLSAPATLTVASAWEPIPNVTHFVGDLLAMTASFCVLAMLAHTIGPSALARHRAKVAAYGLIAAATTMVPLFVVAQTHFAVAFAARYATDLAAVGYELLYVGYMCCGIVGFLLLTRRYALRRDSHGLVWGLRATIAAGGIGLAWATWKCGTIVLIDVLGVSLTHQAAISELLAAGVVALMTVGVTVPMTLSALRRSSARRQAEHDLRALAPLWATLVAEMPHVALPNNAAPADIDYALYRRVIEIRDAQLGLRPYVPPVLPTPEDATARHRVLADTIAAHEATEMQAALHAHRQGTRFDAEGRATPAQPQLRGSTVNDEARWLIRVAHAMNLATPQ